MKERLNYIFGGTAVVLLIAVFWFFSNPRRTQQVQAGFLGLISPFLKQGSSIQRYYVTKKEGLKRLDDLESEVKALRISNKELSATNQGMRKLEEENNKLRNALGYRERAPFMLMPARIIARDSSTWYQKVIIDRGSEEGIEEDQAVLTESGLVGKTTGVISKHSAQVILMSDENCRVSAMIEGAVDQGRGTREQGIVKGERATTGGIPTIGIGFISKQANLKPGMNVYTSGVGGVFPYGVMIGQVRDFKVRELDGYATIQPAVDLSTIEDVFVVISDTK
ncbi:MAG TPA: rod shape-determining protein MreC [Chthoniobacteraceae bacterium]|jgi:rod shape-determining protein MreC|nr:rod shape-determining protein MreC [Chthoniobacteraceae bacterium]